MTGTPPTFCVGADSALASHGLRLLPDDHPGEGPLNGLVTALRKAANDLVVVLACDLVHPSATTIGRLVESANEVAETADRPGWAATVPVAGDRPQWLHGAWRRDICLKPLVGAFDAGERSIHRAAAGLDVRFTEDEGPGFADADVPEDLPERLQLS